MLKTSNPDTEKTKTYPDPHHRPSFLYYGKTSDPVKTSVPNSSSIVDFPPSSSCCQTNPAIHTSSRLSWRHPSASEPPHAAYWDRATKVISTTSDGYDDDDDEEQQKQQRRGGTGQDYDRNAGDWYTIFFSTRLAPVPRKRQWPVVFTYIIVLFSLAIMSGEFIMNRELSGEFFEFDPFNPMLGPSTQTMIQSGARYIPCMKNTTVMPPDERYVCFSKPYGAAQDGFAGSKDDDNEPEEDLKSLINPAFALSNRRVTVRSTCSLQDVCGMGGFLIDTIPDQGFRFITPLFVNSGLIQLGCNMIGHAVIGVRLERLINSLKLTLVFFVSGVFGNLFGANFGPITSQSTGCSSAILGMAACLFVDLILSWQQLIQPVRHLAKVIVLTALCFTLGLLPGADNYSDIGGFIAGLLLGIVVVPPLPRKSRRSMFCLWITRTIAFGTLLCLFIIMSRRFYAADEPDEFCPYCRYISCLPVRGSCDSDDI